MTAGSVSARPGCASTPGYAGRPEGCETVTPPSQTGLIRKGPTVANSGGMGTATRKTERKPLLDDIQSVSDLREELRLEAHLFKAEARQKFEILEQRWGEIEKIAEKLRTESAEAASSPMQTAKKLISELREQYAILKKELSA